MDKKPPIKTVNSIDVDALAEQMNKQREGEGKPIEQWDCIPTEFTKGANLSPSELHTRSTETHTRNEDN